ncbi:hypothetical protein GWK16_09560 [Roseomonas sp. JC162]|uniref:Cellulose synthase operon C C-terminal domain-containing protein n=1 Tax=Neoroseomonas marina TaxID=1232220 RepID=A0A848EBS1_9PROT|nr:cellulose synthase subunit BcsC-related outer membrane protein [Neoroseomonas marina]NMJ41486.1 hypothetical protein [Neoroseomonas marina]
MPRPRPIAGFVSTSPARSRGRDAGEVRSIVESPLTQAQPGGEAIFAAALFVEGEGRAGNAAALIAQVPQGQRSPNMARLAQHRCIAAEIEEAVRGRRFRGPATPARLCRAQVEYSQGAGSLYAGGGYATFTGSRVKANARIEIAAGGSYAVVRQPDETLTLGMDLVYFAYVENLRFFTLGQGGREPAHRLARPVRRLVLAARGGALQGQLRARAADAPGLITAYPSQSESGVIGSLRADLQYAISRDLALGALLRYDRSANWNEARGGVYVVSVAGIAGTGP